MPYPREVTTVLPTERKGSWLFYCCQHGRYPQSSGMILFAVDHLAGCGCTNGSSQAAEQ